MSRYLAQQLLDAIVRNQGYTFPTSIWVALFTDVATEAEIEQGTLTNEVSGLGYARLNKTTANFNAATLADPSVITNNGDLTWASAGVGGWDTVGFVAIMDSDDGGSDNVLMSGALDLDKLVSEGEIFKILDTDLTLSLT